MKNILLALLILLLPINAYAALNANTVWELRSTGADTNGGGFTAGITSKSTQTDLVVNGSDNTKVSSAAYGFTSADVGRYLKVTAGTGWTQGFYQILSVTTGVATLNQSPGATSITAGSFTLYWGLDYTQQNAANTNGSSNGSSVVGVTAGTTTITCSDCLFTNDIVGSVIYVSGGTGSVAAGRYAVTVYTNATTITVDRSTGLTAGTGVTINIGGGLATFGQLLGANGMIAANKAFVKQSGGFSTSTALSTSLSSATPGTWIIGYNTNRNDGATAGNQATLSSTYGAGYTITTTAGSWFVQNILIDCQSTAGCNGITNTGGILDLFNVSVGNYDGIGTFFASGSTGGLCDRCEAYGGTANATAGLKSSHPSGHIYHSYAHDGHGIGIFSTNGGCIQFSIVANMTGATTVGDGIQTSAITQTCPLIGNSVYNNGGYGIDLNNSSATTIAVVNNIAVGNAGGGIRTSSKMQTSPFWDGNAFYNNTGGSYLNMNDRGTSLSVVGVGPYIPVSDVTMTGSPFVSTVTPNWGLNSTAGAGAAAKGAGGGVWTGTASTLGHVDMGAVQHQDPGTITVNPNYSY